MRILRQPPQEGGSSQGTSKGATHDVSGRGVQRGEWAMKATQEGVSPNQSGESFSMQLSVKDAVRRGAMGWRYVCHLSCHLFRYLLFRLLF